MANRILASSEAGSNKQQESKRQTDEQQMLAYAQGDASAFDRLYNRHRLAVYRFFLRQHLSEAVAEELSHDTWLKIINARERYSDDALFKTYLFTVARHVAIDYSRKKSTQNETAGLDESAVENTSAQMSAEQSMALNSQQLNAAIKQQIASLPIEQRETFLLKQESGFSIDEIAEITQQNKEKVKSSWRYAVKKLRAGLQTYVEMTITK